MEYIKSKGVATWTYANNGSIDTVICKGDQISIFEFKLDKTAENVMLRQIQDKEYYQRYLHAGKTRLS